MKPFFAILAAGALLACGSQADAANRYLLPQWRAQGYNWHAQYAHTSYGVPVSLVVPPTANMQTNWSWGVGSSRISRIDHQFSRNYMGPGSAGPYQATPAWPQDTAQFGVYYVRGPWYPTQP